MRSDMVAESPWLDMNRNSRKICSFAIELLIPPPQITKNRLFSGWKPFLLKSQLEFF
jgi:hypothetical protein